MAIYFYKYGTDISLYSGLLKLFYYYFLILGISFEISHDFRAFLAKSDPRDLSHLVSPPCYQGVEARL